MAEKDKPVYDKTKVEYDISFDKPKDVLKGYKPLDYSGIPYDKLGTEIKDPDNKEVGISVKVAKTPIDKLSTGPIGKYINSKLIGEFIANPKIVRRGRYGLITSIDDIDNTLDDNDLNQTD